MAFDIHKKVIVGALGCGAFFVLGFGALFLVGRNGSTIPSGDQDVFMLGQAADSWDSISNASPADLLTMPPMPAWTARGKARGYLYITPDGRDGFPAFDDTFPAGSKEQQNVVLTAQRVAERDPATRPRTDTLPYPPPYIVFFRARIFLAAADDWSHHGDLPGALLAMDTTLALVRVSLQATDLERILTGARIERDALDLLSRDTLLAGGSVAAKRAGAAVESWGRITQVLERADHWMMSAASSNEYDDSLGSVVADSSLPIAWRASAATAIGMGWAFNSGEQGKGIAGQRRKTLEGLRTMQLPDSVVAAIDRITALSTGTFLDRMKAVAAFRVQRQLLFRP